MGIASLIIGIFSIICGILPFCGFFAVLPAAIGLVLGIVDTVIKSKKDTGKGMSIAGIVLNALAIVFILLWLTLFAVSSTVAEENFKEEIEAIQTETINEMQKDINK